MQNLMIKTRTNMKEPNGVDLLSTIIKLYADQEGVIIKYRLIDTKSGKIIEKSTEDKYYGRTENDR